MCCAFTGIYKPGVVVPTTTTTTPITSPSSSPILPGNTATPPKPEAPTPPPAPAFPTKGPLAAVPGQSTFDGCAPGCALCLSSDKSTCLACTDVQTFSNVNGTCVCAAGRGGADCSACETGSYSTGGTKADPMPTCQKCRVGFSTRGPGATAITECTGTKHCSDWLLVSELTTAVEQTCVLGRAIVHLSKPESGCCL